MCCGKGLRTQVQHTFSMFTLLLKVNFRQWYWLLFRLVWPAAMMLVLWGIYVGVGPDTSEAARDQPSVLLGDIPKCFSTRVELQGGCLSVAYAPDNYTEAHRIMSLVAAANGLTISSQVGDNGTNFDIVVFPDRAAILEVMSMRNFTQVAVVFKPPPEFGDWANETKFFEIISQGTYADPFTLGDVAILDLYGPMKKHLEQAYIADLLNAPFELDISAKPSPVISIESSNAGPTTNIGKYYVLTIGMPALLLVAAFAHVMNVVNTLNSDRRHQLRIGLTQVGLTPLPYLFAIFLLQAITGLITAGVMVGVGYGTQVPIFVRCHWGILLLFFWLINMVVSSFALWLGTWIHKPTGNAAMVVISFLIAVIFVCLLPLGFIFPTFWLDPMEVVLASSALSYPANIAAILVWINGFVLSPYPEDAAGFTWDRMSNATFNQYLAGTFNTPQAIYAPQIHFAFMVVHIFGGLMFAWYFDTVWPGPLSPYTTLLFLSSQLFSPAIGTPAILEFVTPLTEPLQYWGLTKPTPIVETNEYDAGKINSILADFDPDVNREYQDVMKATNAEDDEVVLKILKLSKIHRKGRFSKAGDCRALDFLNIYGRKGTCLALLGHNGAGKTTTINLLTGLYPPTFGDALIGPYSIATDISAVRQIIGVCPQKEIIWNQLTGREHLALVCDLRGLWGKRKQQEVEDKLKQVKLVYAADRFAKDYSGGMKRRLALAMAMIGDPLVLFLDEPNAGVDPGNRREIWRLIRELKKDKLVVLTTHSMSEADALADKICIMALGRLRAVGDSLHLKKRFGAGYHVNITTDPDSTATVKETILGVLPESKLDHENAGQLSYSLPSISPHELARFLRFIEENSEEKNAAGKRKKGRENGTDETATESLVPAGVKKLIQEWGFSQTTLEEVFLRLTHGDEFLQTIWKRAEGGGEGGAYSGDKSQLNVAISGGTDPIGFVRVDGGIDLTQLRGIIRRDLPESPAAFRFLSNGVPVSEGQEQRLLAVDFMPLVVIQPTGDAGAAPPPRTRGQGTGQTELLLGPSQPNGDSKEFRSKLAKKTATIKKLKAQIRKMQEAHETSIAELRAQIARMSIFLPPEAEEGQAQPGQYAQPANAFAAAATASATVAMNEP